MGKDKYVYGKDIKTERGRIRKRNLNRIDSIEVMKKKLKKIKHQVKSESRCVMCDTSSEKSVKTGILGKLRRFFAVNKRKEPKENLRNQREKEIQISDNRDDSSTENTGLVERLWSLMPWN